MLSLPEIKVEPGHVREPHRALGAIGLARHHNTGRQEALDREVFLQLSGIPDLAVSGLEGLADAMTTPAQVKVVLGGDAATDSADLKAIKEAVTAHGLAVFVDRLGFCIRDRVATRRASGDVVIAVARVFAVTLVLMSLRFLIVDLTRLGTIHRTIVHDA